MLWTLNLINRCRGIHKAKSSLKGDYLKQFNAALNELSSIGINPVTIPKSYGVDHLPSLTTLLRKFIKDESLTEAYHRIAEEQYMKRKKRRKRKDRG
jgi:hypothetical protein